MFFVALKPLCALLSCFYCYFECSLSCYLPLFTYPRFPSPLCLNIYFTLPLISERALPSLLIPHFFGALLKCHVPRSPSPIFYFPALGLFNLCAIRIVPHTAS
ncbi:hypothetical protein DFJ73DRAFT_810615 [Zopfochytrium polystomum]|nr:hypothetical protein DFJ73DRAFT_810615 [Zopfochytrium polystomum]